MDQQYINGKESFLLLFLYYHVFLCPLQYFTKQHWNPWKAAARDVAETQRGAAASASTWESRGEGPGGSRETESCGGGGEEEEDSGVPPMTPGLDARGRGYPIGEGWRIPGHGI